MVLAFKKNYGTFAETNADTMHPVLYYVCTVIHLRLPTTVMCLAH